ncbi:MAG: hypothetical protein NDF55_00035 [archaeon GB-1867-005]|nr:hypothetical protein [Candidatus Culexmicrobium cathedralense]
MRLIFEHVAYIGCPRFLEPPPKGAGKEHDTLRSTLRRLGLDFIIRDLYD